MKSCGEQHNWKLVTQTMGISRLQLSRNWKFLKAESFSGLKMSLIPRAESFLRLKVSQGWNFLEAESFSGLKVSFNPRAESFSRLKLSQLKVSHGWKCLLESGLQVSCSWKCLRAESVLETFPVELIIIKCFHEGLDAKDFQWSGLLQNGYIIKI